VAAASQFLSQSPQLSREAVILLSLQELIPFLFVHAIAFTGYSREFTFLNGLNEALNSFFAFGKNVREPSNEFCLVSGPGTKDIIPDENLCDNLVNQ
jgi:hypothetical protein